MEDFVKAFDINSSIKNYSIGTLNHSLSLDSYLQKYNLIIIDKNLKDIVNSVPNIHYLECNEYLKSFNNLEIIINLFIQNNINRKSNIIIIGGGVLQDAVSFVCSIFSRGINFDFIPTTLLSMIDSCIGGKTSINYTHFKNKLGNYFPPNKIIIHSSFLQTLPYIQILSGLGELFKFLVIQNNAQKFEKILLNYKNIQNKDIIQILEFKKNYIEKDEFDNGIRLHLNFGHSFGHALEAVSNFEIPHGIAVVLGILIVNRISLQLNLIDIDYMLKIDNYAAPILKEIKLQKNWFNFDNLIPYLKNDKKNFNNVFQLILFTQQNNQMNLLPIKLEELQKGYDLFYTNYIQKLYEN